MKKLPLGIQTFAKLIDQNCVYIDKTREIYNLIEKGSYYFLSRPRRFGKSLLVSTLKELFSGRKELFKDLWICKEKNNFAWAKHPVLHFDFSTISRTTPEILSAGLAWTMDRLGNDFDIDVKNAPAPSAKLKALVEELAKKYGPGSVVILVDEYDKPILDHLHNKELADKQRAILSDFYDAFKGLDQHIKFLFLTGVSKFSKTSIFSGLNNLYDISNSPIAATLVGYTQQELELSFVPHIKQIAQTQKKSTDTVLKNIKEWYNGYRFSSKNEHVYNPYSVLFYLDEKELKSYWFETGTPTFLLHFLRDKYTAIENMINSKVNVSSLGSFTIDNIPLTTLLFQTGYLTIKAFNINTRHYRLGLPNKEVTIAFEQQLLATLAYTHVSEVENVIANMRSHLNNNKLDLFFEDLKTLLANIPYHLHIKQEKYYHSIFQFMCSMLGLDVQSEVATDKGRIDVAIVTKKYIHVLEFKFNASPEIALEQIEKKKYYQKYRTKNKSIILVGVSFNRTKDDLDIQYVSKKLNAE